MTYPPKIRIPVLDAILTARESGLCVELLSGVEIRPHARLISVTTSDPGPMLIVRRHEYTPQPVDELLEVREQTDADRWDYPLSVHCWRDRLVLRLSRGREHRDLAVLESVPAILTTVGWCEDPTILVPALVYAKELAEAFQALGVKSEGPALAGDGAR